MAGYSPLKITGNSTGLVQEREEFILPDDAYPTLQNAYVWRERILRKQGYQLLGRLQRTFSTQSIGNSSASPWTFNLYSSISFTPEATAQIAPGTVQIFFNPSSISGNFVTPGYTIASDCEVYTNTTAGLFTGSDVTISGVVVVPGTGPDSINTYFPGIELIDGTHFKLQTSSQEWGTWQSGGTWSSTTGGSLIFVDQGDGTLTSTTAGNSGTINYTTGQVTLTHTAGSGVAVDVTFGYYPGLPVMGIRIQEVQNSAIDTTIVFDQVYAYIFNSTTYQEFIPGTTWNAAGETVSGTSFFWSTNYWTSSTPLFSTTGTKLFWVTNNTGQFKSLGDPPRITDGVTWVSWWTAPATMQPWTQIDATNYLVNWLSMLPFRGRMVVFNTWEGTSPATSIQFSNRIRWATIGNPFISYSNGPPATGSWRDDIRGQGGYLDIPTSEDIISVGFVRDNLVIYCERSTWQLRYTGRSIAPFQIEKVNSELGGEGPFSAVQFDTSLVGIGDKGIVECDSYQSQRIDIKIPDFVFKSQGQNNGQFRVHGIRDFVNRLAYWTVPIAAKYDPMIPAASQIFPNQRLLYNYENDSWALFDDSLTALGNYQAQSGRTWLNTNLPWIECDFPWIDNVPATSPIIIGGNQQGFVERLDQAVTNDVSLYISNIVGNTTIPTVVTSPNHNMKTGFVIGISGIPATTSFASLNGGVFGIILGDNSDANQTNQFRLMLYNPADGQFSTPQVDVPGDYIGGGLINIREGFSIKSKKFNFLDEGQSIQMGYVDVLMEATEPNYPGAISLNVYLDYNDSEASNTTPENELAGTGTVDLFFNSVIPTTSSTLNTKGGSKFWQRVYCATRASFLTLEYTFSNAQLAGVEQRLKVQIDAQILWIRRSGRIGQL